MDIQRPRTRPRVRKSCGAETENETGNVQSFRDDEARRRARELGRKLASTRERAKWLKEKAEATNRRGDSRVAETDVGAKEPTRDGNGGWQTEAAEGLAGRVGNR